MSKVTEQDIEDESVSLPITFVSNTEREREGGKEKQEEGREDGREDSISKY